MRGQKINNIKKMKKKIIYISSVDLTKFVEDSYGIKYLRKNNLFDTEYWYAHFVFKIKKKPKHIIEPRQKNIVNSIYDLEKQLKYEKERRKIVVVFLLSLDYRTIEIYRTIKKLNIKSVSFCWSFDLINEQYKVNTNIFLKLYIKFFLKINYFQYFGEIFSYLKIRVYKLLNLIKDSEITFYTGSIAKSDLIHKKNKSKLIGFNCFDNDKLIDIKNKKKYIKQKYCLFLDSAVTSADHTDRYINNEKNMTGLHTSYFNSLNKFFEAVEKKYNLKVIISRHPKNNLNLKKYLNRASYDYKTPELVKDAEFLICHHSLSSNYGILLNKPIIFIYNDKMLVRSKAINSIVDLIKLYGKTLNQPTINIDKVFFFPKIKDLKANMKKYELYRNQYLLTKSNKDAYSKKIFYENLRNLINT